MHVSPKKTVLIYSEYWHSRGGGEKYLLHIAETLLRSNYAVTIVAQTESFDKVSLERYFHVNIDEATIRFVTGNMPTLRAEAEAMSTSFDICIYMTNYRFFPSRARQTFAVLQVPYGAITVFTLARKAIRESIKETAKDYVRLRLFKQLRNTQAVLVYSQFVHDAIDFAHDIPSTVLEPAIDDFLVEGALKERLILSVGRIFRGLYNDKRYDILIDAFKRLYQRLPNTTWQYRIVGSCGHDETSQRYLEQLRESAKGFPVYIHINASYEDVKRSYNEATLFWHAAGFGVGNQWDTPQRAEHFGMSTLEAMSARAIPLVVNCGGQKEIVSDSESGYLWNTEDELVERSIALMDNPPLLSHMQTQARERFKGFDRERFSQKLISILEP